MEGRINNLFIFIAVCWSHWWTSEILCYGIRRGFRLYEKHFNWNVTEEIIKPYFESYCVFLRFIDWIPDEQFSELSAINMKQLIIKTKIKSFAFVLALFEHIKFFHVESSMVTSDMKFKLSDGKFTRRAHCKWQKTWLWAIVSGDGDNYCSMKWCKSLPSRRKWRVAMISAQWFTCNFPLMSPTSVSRIACTVVWK